MTDTVTISKAIESIITSNGYYRNKWICDESLVRISHMHKPDLKNIEGMRKIVVKHLNSKAGCFDKSNVNKIYMKEFKTKSPYPEENRRMVYYYYFGTG